METAHLQTVTVIYSPATIRRIHLKLSNLPNELLLKIFNYLDPVVATMLGLTCKRLYRLYKTVYPRVSLFEFSFGYNRSVNAGFMWEVIKDWMGPTYYFCHHRPARFVTKKRLTERKDEYLNPWKYLRFGVLRGDEY